MPNRQNKYIGVKSVHFVGSAFFFVEYLPEDGRKRPKHVGGLSYFPVLLCLIIHGNHKVSVHLMITVQKNTQKYFKLFQSITMIT
jgi:hypothetical protein